ncbi:DUF4367 domain-containing protein [Alcanivoracaceae bacterium MT1]
MNEYNNNKKEDFIKQLVNEKFSSSQNPMIPPDKAWKRIESELKGKKDRFTPAHKKIIAIATIIFLVTTSYFLFPKNSVAFSKLTDVFHSVQGTFVQVFMKIDDGNTEEINVTSNEDFKVIDDSEITMEDMALEDAKRISSFPIRMPSYIPDKYSLKDVTVLRKKELTNSIFLNYEAPNKIFKIHQMQVNTQLGAGGIHSNENAIEKVKINNIYDGTLIIQSNGTSKLVWVTQDMFISIEGELTKEEILTIASSL